VTSLCDELYTGNGHALAQLWRAKQLQYSLLRSMMHRYKDFWQLTQDALAYAGKRLKLELTDATRQRLMDAYRTLAPFPDVKLGLEALTQCGLRLVILSNGEPDMLNAAIVNAGLGGLLERIISVDEAKVFKPNPRVYRLIGDSLKMSPNASASCRRIRGTSTVPGRLACARSGFSVVRTSRKRSWGIRHDPSPVPSPSLRVSSHHRRRRCSLPDSHFKA
jgi:2-haloalkanoic acid dehalogenase type II